MQGVKIPEEIEDEIVRLYESGVRVKEIAEKFGISRRSVYNILKRKGIVLRRDREKVMDIFGDFLKEFRNFTKEKFMEILRVGKHVVEKYKARADELGMTVEEYIDAVFEGFEDLRAKVEYLQDTIQEISKERDIYFFLYHTLRKKLNRRSFIFL